MLHAKAHKHIEHTKLIELQSLRGGYSMILPRPEHPESNQQEHDDRDKKKQIELLGSFSRFSHKPS
jgi:hypothetical protein